MDDRKGFLTPEQEEKIDGLIKLSGIAEAFDGIAIRLADNIGLEKLKAKIPEDVLPTVLEVIDQIMDAIPDE
jgi:hypothetical protein